MGGAHVGSAQALSHGEAVGLGQHDVQDDDVVGARPTVLHAGLPIVHDVGGVAVVLKDAGQRLGEAGVVFHDQNVHGDPFRKGPPPRAVVCRRLGGLGCGVSRCASGTVRPEEALGFIVAAHLKAT